LVGVRDVLIREGSKKGERRQSELAFPFLSSKVGSNNNNNNSISSTTQQQHPTE